MFCRIVPYECDSGLNKKIVEIIIGDKILQEILNEQQTYK